MKKAVDRRERILRTLNGLPLRGRPQGRRTGTKPGERSIPQAWRDLDNGCLEFALNELNDESLDDESLDRLFVKYAVRRGRIHEQKGDYKIIKLSGRPTGPRRLRTHEQRVRQLARAKLEEADRAALEPQGVS
jgi:hypothetical protein